MMATFAQPPLAKTFNLSTKQIQNRERTGERRSPRGVVVAIGSISATFNIG